MVNVPSNLRVPPKWVLKEVKVVKYIDDALIMEKTNIHSEPLLDTLEGRVREARAPLSEQMFAYIAQRAADVEW